MKRISTFLVALLIPTGATAQGVPQKTPSRAPLTIVAPETAGGAYDVLARAVATTLQKSKLTPQVTVTNKPGGGGVSGMNSFLKAKMPGSLIVLGLTTMGRVTLKPQHGITFASLTPIARLTADYEVLVVPKDSPYRSVADLARAYQRAPEKIRFGGGSAGGAGYLFIVSLLRAAGASPKSLVWVESSGNYQGLRAMYPSGGSALDVASTSYGVAAADIRQGKLRALALSAPEPVPGIPVKTATQLGYPVDVVNWRGIFALPGTSQKDQATLADLFVQLSRTPLWRSTLKEQKLNSYFQSAVPYSYFLEREQRRVREQFATLGLLK